MRYSSLEKQPTKANTADTPLLLYWFPLSVFPSSAWLLLELSRLLFYLSLRCTVLLSEYFHLWFTLFLRHPQPFSLVKKAFQQQYGEESKLPLPFAVHTYTLTGNFCQHLRHSLTNSLFFQHIHRQLWFKIGLSIAMHHGAAWRKQWLLLQYSWKNPRQTEEPVDYDPHGVARDEHDWAENYFYFSLSTGRRG